MFLSPYLVAVYTVFICVCLGMLVLRFILGPTQLDRLAAMESITIVMLCLIAIWSVVLGSVWLYDVILVTSLVGFIATIALARFVETGRITG